MTTFSEVVDRLAAVDGQAGANVLQRKVGGNGLTTAVGQADMAAVPQRR